MITLLRSTDVISNFCGHVYMIKPQLQSVCAVALCACYRACTSPAPARWDALRSPLWLAGWDPSTARCLLAVLCWTRDHPLELSSLQSLGSVSSSPLTNGDWGLWPKSILFAEKVLTSSTAFQIKYKYFPLLHPMIWVALQKIYLHTLDPLAYYFQTAQEFTSATPLHRTGMWLMLA